MQNETHYGKLDALKKALENFDKLDLEDKGDRQRAIEKITYLSLRKGAYYLHFFVNGSL